MSGLLSLFFLQFRKEQMLSVLSFSWSWHSLLRLCYQCPLGMLCPCWLITSSYLSICSDASEVWEPKDDGVEKWEDNWGEAGGLYLCRGPAGWTEGWKSSSFLCVPVFPQLREALWHPSMFSCPFLPPALSHYPGPQPWWPGLTLLLKSLSKEFLWPQAAHPWFPSPKGRMGVVPASSPTMFVGVA